MFISSSNCAVYEISQVTASTTGLQVWLNVYVYWGVPALVGIDQVYSGISSYATCSVFNVLPSQSIHVISYLFIVPVNSATYVASHVTGTISGSHLSNSMIINY